MISSTNVQIGILLVILILCYWVIRRSAMVLIPAKMKQFQYSTEIYRLYIFAFYCGVCYLLWHVNNNEEKGWIIYKLFGLCGIIGIILAIYTILKRKEYISFLGIILLTAYLSALFSVTIFTRIDSSHGVQTKMILLNTLSVSNPYVAWQGPHLLENVVLFIPGGISLALCIQKQYASVWKSFYYGCFLTVFIETTQKVFALGQCDIDDMLMNVLGCMIGYAAICWWRTYRQKTSSSEIC